MVQYRLASEADNPQLIALTAASGMAGDIALRIDRYPDFFRLLDMRGESRVFVAEDNGIIIGSICTSRQAVYVDGVIYPVQYIGDFKVLKTYRNKGVGRELSNLLAAYFLENGVDLAMLNVAKGNTKPLSFFKNRPGIPDFDPIGRFTIHQFPGLKKRVTHPIYSIKQEPVSPALIDFYNQHYSRYQLGTVISDTTLRDTEHYVIRQHGQMTAAMCLTDTMHAKQNVITQVPWYLAMLLTTLNRLQKVLGCSPMPVKGQPVRMKYIKFLAIENQDPALVQLLVRHAQNRVFDSGYSFAAMGLHEKDPLQQGIAGMFKLTFYSAAMLLSMHNNRALIAQVKQGVPFEDYSLV